MAETIAQPVRIHRVTTRRRSLRALECPLESELIVGEFAGELPPHVARAVREHTAICEECGARATELRRPYELLSSLGTEPVEYIPDLRATVNERLARGRFARTALRTARVLGQGGTLGITTLVGMITLLMF